MTAKQRGFTLIEVMIALFIFTIMMSIAGVGLWTVMKTKQRLEIRSQQLQQLQIAMLLLGQDISQAVNRAIMNERGETQTSFLGTFKNNPYLEFTHLGYSNPLINLNQSSLQRVAYEFKNKQLLRITWPVLDRAPTTTPTTYPILNQLEHLRIRYLAANKQFYDSWPPPVPNYSIVQLPLPQAVEMTFDFGKDGKIIRLFPIMGSGFVAQ